MSAKEEVYIEVIGFMRNACAELISVVDAGVKFYPRDLRREALQFVANSRAVIAKVNGLLELVGDPPPSASEPDEWYDALGRPSQTGAYDAGGHYHADRDQGVDCDED